MSACDLPRLMGRWTKNGLLSKQLGVFRLRWCWSRFRRAVYVNNNTHYDHYALLPLRYVSGHTGVQFSAFDIQVPDLRAAQVYSTIACRRTLWEIFHPAYQNAELLLGGGGGAKGRRASQRWAIEWVLTISAWGPPFFIRLVNCFRK